MNRLLAAAKSHCEARRDEAVANLEVYFTKPAGIGEHSDLQEEIRKWTETLANAEDCLDALSKYFADDGSPK